MKNSVSANVRILVFFLLTMSMATANAVPIVFDWTGDATSNGWTGTGEVVIDSANFGNVLDANLLEQWSFSWTDGITTHGIDHTIGMFISGFDEFTVDASGVVTDYNLVAGLPGADATDLIYDYPLIGLSSGVFSSWGATTALGTETGLSFSNGWGEGVPVQVVPLPGTLTLLGAGLLALSIRRKQTQTIKPSK